MILNLTEKYFSSCYRTTLLNLENNLSICTVVPCNRFHLIHVHILLPKNVFYRWQIACCCLSLAVPWITCPKHKRMEVGECKKENLRKVLVKTYDRKNTKTAPCRSKIISKFEKCNYKLLKKLIKKAKKLKKTVKELQKAAAKKAKKSGKKWSGKLPQDLGPTVRFFY